MGGAWTCDPSVEREVSASFLRPATLPSVPGLQRATSWHADLLARTCSAERAGSTRRDGILARDWRLVGRNLDDDRRDVVEAAASVRLGDERMNLSFRRGARHEQNLKAAVVDHAGEAVARDQEQVADPDLALIDVGLDFGARPHASRDHVAVGVIARLLGSEKAGIDLLLHVRMILGELLQLAIAQQIHAGIADLSDQVLRLPDHEDRRGGAHPLLVHFGNRAVVNRSIGLTERLGDLLLALI